MATGPVPVPERGPARDTEAAPTARHVRRVLEGALETLEAAAARTRALADDEGVHDLRVASRRLTARLEFWRPVLRRRRARRARRRLRSLRRRLGPMRELEAALALLRERLDGLPPGAREALALVRVGLETRLPIERRRAAAIATLRRLARIRRAVERAARDVEARTGDARDLEARLAAELAARREVAARRLAAALPGGDDVALHAARVAVKRWRYGVESARDLANDSGTNAQSAPASRRPDPALKRLRALQEALGEVQDVAVLRALLEAETDRPASGGGPDRAAALQAAFERLAAIRAEAVAAAAAIVPALDSLRP